MSKHPKYDAVRDAISSLAGDTSVSREVTKDALENLRADIDGQLDAIKEDEAAQADED